jgi:hypothetical protein
MSNKPPKPSVINLSLTFKFIVIADLLLTVLSLCVALGLSFVSEPTPNQNSLFQTCSTTWKMGVGAFLGLIGGKAA